MPSDMPQGASDTERAQVYDRTVRSIGLWHIALAVLLLVLLFLIWPEREEGGKWSPIQLPFGQRTIGDDARLLLIVMSAGALGSCVHAATSFASYVGNKSLVLSWAWWYFLRPFIGMSLATIFYFVLRGGLMATGAEAKEMSVFGIAAVAGLAGMFSKQATDKLRELFDNLFRTAQGQGDDARANKLGASLVVRNAMIDRRKIAAFVLSEGQTAREVPVVRLHEMLQGVVTRIPVLDHADVALCVVHQSLLYKFLADRSIAALKRKEGLDAEALTLADLLAVPGMKELVQDSLAYVPEGATLASAKELMERTPHCQDVFVTAHGQPGEPVLGWLTDADIRRAAKA